MVASYERIDRVILCSQNFISEKRNTTKITGNADRPLRGLRVESLDLQPTLRFAFLKRHEAWGRLQKVLEDI